MKLAYLRRNLSRQAGSSINVANGLVHFTTLKHHLYKWLVRKPYNQKIWLTILPNFL